MVKMILFASIGLVVGLAGGTGVAVLTAPPLKAPPPAGHAAPSPVTPADENAHAAAPGRAAPPVTPPVTPPAAAAPSSTAAPPAMQAVTADAGSSPHPIPLPVPIPRPVTPTRELHGGFAELTPPADYTKVSKILVAMKPDEATRILVLLNDEQVEGILRVLGARQAAAILGALPPERGAALSKRLMHPEAEVK
jgi:hypothetical protein